jgi:hypothetical protein
MRLGRTGLDPALCESFRATMAARSALVTTRRPPATRFTSTAAVSASSLMTSTPASSPSTQLPALPSAGEVSERTGWELPMASASMSSDTRHASPRSPRPTHSCQNPPQTPRAVRRLPQKRRNRRNRRNGETGETGETEKPEKRRNRRNREERKRRNDSHGAGAEDEPAVGRVGGDPRIGAGAGLVCLGLCLG